MNKKKVLTSLAIPAGRYRRGKPLAGAVEIEESTDEDQSEQSEQEEEKERGEMKIRMNQVKVDESGQVIVDGKLESGRTQRELQDGQSLHSHTIFNTTNYSYGNRSSSIK